MIMNQDKGLSIPNSWIWASLGNINLHSGGTIEPSRFPDETFEYYSIPAYQESQLPIYSFGKDIGSSKLLLQPGTLLFGKLNPRVEKVWRVSNYSSYRKVGSTEWLPILPDKSVSEDYVYYLLWSEHVMPIAKTMVSGSTPSRQRVNPSAFYRISIPLPPLPEQRKIAAVMNLVQQAIEQQERLIDFTTELKKTLMHKLFTEGLHGEKQKETEIGLVPESWFLTPLDRTGEIIYGIQAAVASNTEPIGIPILTNKNITLSGNIDLEQINYFEIKTARHKSTILQKGDLLFNWRSGSKEHVGKTAYFDLESEYTHSSFILRIRPNKETNSRFLYYYLNYLREAGYFVRAQTYAVNAKFNKSAVSSIPLYIPEKPEQDDIADLLDVVNNKELYAHRKYALLLELFRTLLHQLMTAQIRVNDLDLSGLEEQLKE